MKILYISAMASMAAIRDAQIESSSFASYAVQKFNRLIADGLSRNGNEVTAISTFYIPGIGNGYKRKVETQGGVRFRYVSSPSVMCLRNIWVLVACFSRVLWWSLSDRRNKVVMCDVLNISACLGALAAARLTKVCCTGIMTDMPGIGVGDNNSRVSCRYKISLTARLNKSYLGYFSHYVFLTEAMNEAVNKRKRPYIVMEGLVDTNMQLPKLQEKANHRIVIYAGGLYERYGLKLLVEGFLEADVPDTELWLYGKGSFAEEIERYNRVDNRVIYKGIRPNDEVVANELRATLLVNPRPTGEEFTRFSFPSKNMEYMVSGTPVLTTMLPGMPKEYYPYVYLFDQGETIEGYAKVLRDVLKKPTEELQTKGLEARRWVLDNKNHIKQTARIVELIKKK